MYTVEVYNKNKKLIETYHNIHTITYIDTLGEKNIVTGDDLLTFSFEYSIVASLSSFLSIIFYTHNRFQHHPEHSSLTSFIQIRSHFNNVV